MSAREGREAWDWARAHYPNNHTGDPRPHRSTCQCGSCPVCVRCGKRLTSNDPAVTTLGPRCAACFVGTSS